MSPQYQLVLFNVDRPSEPSQAKQLFVTKEQYESVKSLVDVELHLEDNEYYVISWRAFDLTSNLFGTRHMLIIDVKKK